MEFLSRKSVNYKKNLELSAFVVYITANYPFIKRKKIETLHAMSLSLCVVKTQFIASL